VALLASVYVLAGKLGLTLAYVNASATAVWPPAGIALAALLVLGPARMARRVTRLVSPQRDQNGSLATAAGSRSAIRSNL